MLSKNDIQFIRSLAIKKYRQKYHNYLAEGEKILSEIIRHCPSKIKRLYCLPAFIDKYASEIERKGISFIRVSEKELNRISLLKSPNMGLAILDMTPVDITQKSYERILYLDDVRDPGNLGSIFRTAEWFGVDLLILSPESVDPYNPKLVQATMGSLFRQAFIQMDLDSFIGKNHSKYSFYRAEMSGEDAFSMDFTYPNILIMGNESQGIKIKTPKEFTTSITIPKPGSSTESLNVGVAASLLMAEIYKKRPLK